MHRDDDRHCDAVYCCSTLNMAVAHDESSIINSRLQDRLVSTNISKPTGVEKASCKSRSLDQLRRGRRVAMKQKFSVCLISLLFLIVTGKQGQNNRPKLGTLRINNQKKASLRRLQGPQHATEEEKLEKLKKLRVLN